MSRRLVCRECYREIPEGLVESSAVAEHNGGCHLCTTCMDLRIAKEHRRISDGWRRDKGEAYPDLT